MSVVEEDDGIRPDVAALAADRANKLFSYGATIDHEWLKDNLDCKLEPGRLYTVDQVQRHQLAFLSVFDSFRQYMLINYKKFLVSSRGKGYVIALPEEQHERAFESWVRGIRGLNKKTLDAITHVDTTLLTSEAERGRSDVIAKVAGVSQLFTRQVRRGFSLG